MSCTIFFCAEEKIKMKKMPNFEELQRTTVLKGDIEYHKLHPSLQKWAQKPFFSVEAPTHFFYLIAARHGSPTVVTYCTTPNPRARLCLGATKVGVSVIPFQEVRFVRFFFLQKRRVRNNFRCLQSFLLWSTPPRKRTFSKKGSFSIKNTSSNHSCLGDMLVFQGVRGVFVSILKWFEANKAVRYIQFWW